VDFEWDDAKAAANRAKHGIAFDDAMDVFEDPYCIDEDSTRPGDGETRRKVVGRVGPIMIAVIYTDRLGSRRIISARRARRNERLQYDQGSTAG
jgi:uncharacterized protein